MTRLGLIGMLLSFLCCSVSSVSAQEQPANRWAILIGVNDYAELSDLRYCSNDVQALRDQLVASGFPKEQVLLLHDGAKDRRYLPLRNNFREQLNRILGLVERGDLVVVSFCGHGFYRAGESWLCPREADLARPEETMVSLKSVYERLDTSKAALKLVMLDACRNDFNPAGQKSARATKGVNRSFVEALQSPPQGILLMTSCAAGEVSMGDEDFGHGVFMNFVTEGLNGSADTDKSGKVSLSELRKFTNRKTKNHVARRYSVSQRPGFQGRLTDNFDISTVIAPAETLITNTIGMKLKLIPAGEFMMGATRSSARLAALFDMASVYFDDESPQHRVRISMPFYLQTTEVTQGQWESAMGTSPWSGQDYVKEGSDYAASYVSWNDAVEFCRRLSAKEGLKYRLPREAEWEYASRGGSTSMYSFGDNLGSLKHYAWFAVNASDSGDVYAHRPGQKRANGFGLYDMHGNVYEWCSDRFGKEYYKSSPLSDPEGPSVGAFRVFRGGGWGDSPLKVRSAFRLWGPQDDRGSRMGFRVLRTSTK